MAVVVALATGVGVAFVPMGKSTTVGEGGASITTSVSLLANEGAGIFAIVAIPAVLVAVPLMLRRRRAAFVSRAVVVGLLGALVVLGALSIGIFFVPTLAAMAGSLATSTTQPSPR